MLILEQILARLFELEKYTTAHPYLWLRASVYE